MTSFFRKSAIIGLLSIFSLVSLFGVPAGVYAKIDKPSISVNDRNANSIVLRVRQTSLDKDKVTIRVRVEKVSTGEKFDRTFKVTMNKEGKKNVTLSNLLSNTQYKIKAQIKKRGMGDYSDFSKAKKVTTRT